MGCNRSIYSFIARLVIARSLYCTIADRSDRFATSMSLRKMFRNELVLKSFDNYQ